MTSTNHDRRRTGRRSARTARVRRTLAAVTASAVALAGALVATGTTVAGAPTAVAAPGSPRVPQPPETLFEEDWENAGDAPNVLITEYVGAMSSYTADPDWADRPLCNGFVIDFTSVQQADDCSAANPVVETPLESFDHLQGMTYALGEYAGDPSPETNAALSSYTSQQSPIAAPQVVGEAMSALVLPDAGGYVQFTADYATMNCGSGQAILEFVVVEADGTEHPIIGQDFSTQFSPCSGTTVETVTTPDGEEIEVVLSTYVSGLVSGLPAGEPLSVLMRNLEGTGTGNDVVVDNISAVELAPQLDKDFDPAVTPVGTSSTLTFTVTNTSDLGAKPAYSFTDTLPPGLVVADPANAVADPECGLYFWGPAPGSSTLTVGSGGIPEGMESCSFSVDVTSDTAEVYVNGPDNITDLVGLSPPADATVEFTDDEPEAGLTITKEASVTDAAPGDTVEYTITVENSGQVAYTDADPATFTDDLSGVLDDATFVSADADTGTVDTSALPTLTWSGALDVGDTATITYAVTVDDPPGGDGVLTNAVVGPPESSCVDGTEDGCATETPVRGLTITKTADPDEALVPGEDITYTITVENTGQYDYTTADPATLTDDMSDLIDDATYNDDATADVGTVTYAAPELTWSGPLAAGETATITYTVTAGPEGSGDGTAVNRVTGPPESNCDDGTEDGCFVVIPPSGLAITKTADANVVVPGETVTYTVTVTNSGEVPYTAGSPATFTDDLTEVLDDATYDGNATADVGTVDDSAPPVLAWSGALGVGETATITYSVTVDDPVPGDGTLTNAVVGPVESTCVDGTEEGCTTTVRVRSLEITKEVDATEVAPGNRVGYTVTVTNTGAAPYTVVSPATFSDDLSDVLDDATYDGDATASTGVVDDSGLPVLTWTGTLVPGESATITYSVTVDDPVTGDHVLDNVVTGPDESTCPDGVDPVPDGCATSTPVRALTIVKTVEPGEELLPGEVLTYTITVTNSGEVDYTAADPAEITDDLTEVLDDATYNGDASADVGTVDDSAPPLITWSGPLAVDQTATITFSVTVDDPLSGDGVALNTVTGPPESNCVDGTEEGCWVTTPPKSLGITKSVDADEVVPGQTVTYTITVENTGEVPYTAAAPAEITDDASGVADDTTYAGDASADTGTVDDTAFPTLTWSGALDPGEVATITYSVTVNDPLSGDGLLENAVTGPIESDCRDGDEEGCSTSTPVRALDVTKTVDVTDAAPGDVVTYTITVENIGQVGYDVPDWAEVTDDLSGVLDDATYNGDAAATSGATTFASPLLQWRSVLAPGEAATITYSVTVDDPVTGDGMLTNSVVGPDESGCPAADPCTTDTPVRGLIVTKSADPDDALVPGQDVTYTITVENTGRYDYTAADPATITDDMSAVVDDATYNDDASADVGTVDDSAMPTLTWSGPLAVGETATITYTVTPGPAGSGDGVAENTVTGPAESNCRTGAEDGCLVTIPPRSLDLTKSVDAAEAAPGDTLTYTILVTNSGSVDYGPDHPAVVVDDLTAVLTDATYAGDATATSGTVDDSALPELTWTGELAAGESATITFSVVVDDPLAEATTLVNTVTGPAESNCPVDMGEAGEGAAAPLALAPIGVGCTVETVVTPTPTPTPSPTDSPSPSPTTTPSPEPSTTTAPTPTAAPTTSPTTAPDDGPLPVTGGDVALAAALAVLLLVTGLFLVSVVRRRRQG